MIREKVHQQIDKLLDTGVPWIVCLTPSEAELAAPSERSVPNYLDEKSWLRVSFLDPTSQEVLLNAGGRIIDFSLSGFPPEVQDGATVSMVDPQTGKRGEISLRQLVQLWSLMVKQSDAEELGCPELAEAASRIIAALEELDAEDLAAEQQSCSENGQLIAASQ